MTTWSPVTGLPIQYSEDASGTAASGNYLKFYASGTTTPINMATDSTGGTTLAKCQLNSLGQAINGSSAVFIPHIDQKYKAVLYPDSITADANTFASAIWVVDGITDQGSAVRSSGEYVKDFDTMAAAIASTTLVAGDVLVIKDRANSTWDAVLSSGVTETGYDIVQCTGVPSLSLQLRLENGNTINVKALGAKDDGTTNNYLIFKAASAMLDDYRCVVFDGDGTFLVDVAAGDVPDVADDDAIGIFKLREHRGVSFVGKGKPKIRIEVDFTDGGSLAFLHAQGARETLVQGLNIDYQASGGITLGAGCRASILHMHSSDTNPCSNNTIRDNVFRINHPDGPNFGYSEGNDAGKVIGIYVYGEKSGGVAENNKFINNTFWNTTARVIWLWRTRNTLGQGNVFLQSGEYPCFRCLRGNENLSLIGNIFDMIQDGTFHSACIAIYAQGIASFGHVVQGNIFRVANGKGMELSEITDSQIKDNIIYRPSTALGDLREAIYLDSAAGDANVEITGNIVNRSIVFLGTGNNVRISKNQVYGGVSIGYSGDPVASTERENHSVCDNIISGGGGIEFRATSGSCSGNLIENADYYGIKQREATYQTLIHVQNNIVRGFNASGTTGTAPNNFHGIWIAGGNCVVTGNSVYAATVTANSYGIYAPSVTGDKTIITNNNMKGAATGNYGANTIVYNNIVGNALVP